VNFQLFFFLRDPEWLSKCGLDTQTMATLCKRPPSSLEELEPEKLSDTQVPPKVSKGASLATEIKFLGEPQGIYPTLRESVSAPTAPFYPLI
jgi:hypothetical protein